MSIALRFVSTANKINRVKLKADLEEYRRKLLVMQHFRNDEVSFVTERFRTNTSFGPRNKDFIIENILAAWKKDGYALRILLKDLTILHRKKGMLFMVSKMTLVLSLKLLTRVLL